MSPTETSKWHHSLCFPRVSGDEPERPHYPAIDAVFSPRERG